MNGSDHKMVASYICSMKNAMLSISMYMALTLISKKYIYFTGPSPINIVLVKQQYTYTNAHLSLLHCGSQYWVGEKVP